MTRPQEIKKEVLELKSKITKLIVERNKLIRDKYKELYNITTYNKVKVGYVYSQLSKEFELQEVTIRNIVATEKDESL